MKIDEMNQQAAVAYVAPARGEKQAEVADAHGDSASRQQRTADKVDLSGKIPVAEASGGRDEIRASRVEELKAQIAAGTYEIPAQAVAEKMLSKLGASA